MTLEKIRAEAAAWLSRLRSDRLTEADRSAFQAWLKESADHGAAFEAINNAWESIGAVPHDLRGYRDPKATGVTRRKVLAGVGLLLVAGAGAAYWQSAQADVYETAIGEQRHFVIGDGCQVFLDTDSRLVVPRRSPRSVTLERGCANFRVIVNGNNPFVVSAGREIVTTSRSNMDVRLDGAQVSVLVIEGEASVSKQLGYGVSKLAAGDRLAIDGAGTVVLDRPQTDASLAWHNGQANFRNERLADAIAQMNRYSMVKLIITDPATANERISGVYSVGDNLAFAGSIAKLLPLRVKYSNERIEISADESH